jgi:hypothetical protein
MVDIIAVEPLAEGWTVRHPDFVNAQIFLSGAKAEAAALRLGSSLARAGRPAEVMIYLRGGRLGGRFICPAEGPPGRAAAAAAVAG